MEIILSRKGHSSGVKYSKSRTALPKIDGKALQPTHLPTTHPMLCRSERRAAITAPPLPLCASTHCWDPSKEAGGVAVGLPGTSPSMSGFSLSPLPFYLKRRAYRLREVQTSFSPLKHAGDLGWIKIRCRGRSGSQRSIDPRKLTQQWSISSNVA